MICNGFLCSPEGPMIELIPIQILSIWTSFRFNQWAWLNICRIIGLSCIRFSLDSVIWDLLLFWNRGISASTDTVEHGIVIYLMVHKIILSYPFYANIYFSVVIYAILLFSHFWIGSFIKLTSKHKQSFAERINEVFL